MAMIFPITVKQGQVTICFKCLSDKLRTVLQQDTAFSKNDLEVFTKFTAHHIFLRMLGV